mmetsp:Transcript_51400/g.95038  ORF Transcript_51400/g.95038 Transcript_51400/m.95038 type:complete len:355 (+) Transcript_51400:103-1167(+)
MPTMRRFPELLLALSPCLLQRLVVASRPSGASQPGFVAPALEDYRRDVDSSPKESPSSHHALMLQKQAVTVHDYDAASASNTSSSKESGTVPTSPHEEAAPKEECGGKSCSKAWQLAQLHVTRAAQRKAYFEEQLRSISAQIAADQEAGSQLDANMKVWVADKDSAVEELKQLKEAGMDALRNIKSTQALAVEAGHSAREKAKAESLLGVHAHEVASALRSGGTRDKQIRGLDPVTELQGTTVLVEDGAATLEERLQLLLGRIAAGEKAKEQLDAHLTALSSSKASAEDKLKKAQEELHEAQDDMEAVLHGRPRKTRSSSRLAGRQSPSSHSPPSRRGNSPLADFDASLVPFGP